MATTTNLINPYRFATATVPITGPGASWSHAFKITVAASQVGSTLTNFPVRFRLSDAPASFHSTVKSDGADIRVYTSGDVQVARFVSVIVTGSSTGELWFNAPSLSSSTDTSFWVFYGNAGASGYAVGDTYGRYNTFNPSLHAAYSFRTDPSGGAVLNDHTGGSKTGTAVNYSTDDRTTGGTFYYGWSFNGTSQHVTFANSTDLQVNASTTIIMWVAPDDATPTTTEVLASKRDSGSGNKGWEMNLQTGGAVRVLLDDDAAAYFVDTTSTLSDSTLAMIGLRHASTTLEAIYNGALQGSSSTSGHAGFTNTTILTVGYRSSGVGSNDYLDGKIELMMVAQSSLSADWLAAHYSMGSTPLTFYSVGAHTPT